MCQSKLQLDLVSFKKMNQSKYFQTSDRVRVANSYFYSQNLAKHTATLPRPLLPIANYVNQVLVHFFGQLCCHRTNL